MNEKEKLYYLIIEYLKENYNCEDFSYHFSYIYDIDLDKSILNEIEKKEFNDLAVMANRFSNIEEDLKIKNLYFNEEQILNKVKDIAIKLKLK